MAIAYKVAGNSFRPRGGKTHGVLVDKPNPWEPYTLKLLPKTINDRRYWPGDTVYRRWRLSPSGGYWQYGDEFDYLRWQP